MSFIAAATRLPRRSLAVAAAATALLGSAQTVAQAGTAPASVKTLAATAATLSTSATNYTGKGFDACSAPSAATMSAWKSSSPYGAVGIYFGGDKRACDQPNLTASWVQQQAAAGWKFIPLYVGPQAGEIVSPDSEGAAAADDAVVQASALGFGQGATLYYDMEYYSSGTATVLSFLSAWTSEIHAKGYNSGVYSSASAAITDLVNAGSGYQLPDVLYTARYNGVADTSDPVIPSTEWANHQRIHQYSGTHTETWGGVSLSIDQDYLDVSLPSSPTSRSGDVWDRVRGADGTWAGSATKVDANSSITAEATASLPDRTEHLFTVVPGSGIWERVRAADGTWAGSATKIDANGAITAVTAAGLPDGSVQLEALIPNSGVWQRSRSADGTWQANAVKIDTNGSISALSSAALPDGTVHLFAVVPGSGIWERVRGTDGTWGGSAAKIDANGSITAVTAAGLPDGSIQLEALIPNSGVWQRSRAANGTWQASAVKIDANGAVAAQTSASLPDGTTHLFTIVPGSGIWDRVRAADGTWAGSATKIDANGSIFAAAAAGLPNGTLDLTDLV